VDLATDYREAFIQSQYLQIPSFPGAVKDLGDLVASDARAQPPGKYGLLTAAAEWTTNIGHPGYSNAAIDEVVKESLISQMFAAAARNEMSAQEAVRGAEAKIKPIYEKWRAQGKI
jgi:multiple sugar transport system substrate-binding protein